MVWQTAKIKTDRQVIVVFLHGTADDNVITSNADALNGYAATKGVVSEIVKVRRTSRATSSSPFSGRDRQKLKVAFAKLTSRSRVYLQAHGDWQSQKLCEWTGAQVAQLLIDTGMPAVRLISVLGCELGRDLGTANDNRVSNSVDNFGAKLHQKLKDGGILTSVYVRVFLVAIMSSAYSGGLQHGQKGTFNKDDAWDDPALAHGRSHSKRRFYWDGGTQRWSWAA